MSDRNRRILIGFGLMFGLQFVLALIARLWFGQVGDVSNIVGILLIFTIAIYFGGGLVMGLITDTVNLVELIITAAVAVLANTVLGYVFTSPDLSFITAASYSKSPIVNFAINFSSVIIASIIGYFIGVRIQRQPNEISEVSIAPERNKAKEATQAAAK